MLAVDWLSQSREKLSCFPIKHSSSYKFKQPEIYSWVEGKKVKNDILNLTDIFSSFCCPECMFQWSR